MFGSSYFGAAEGSSCKRKGILGLLEKLPPNFELEALLIM